MLGLEIKGGMAFEEPEGWERFCWLGKEAMVSKCERNERRKRAYHIARRDCEDDGEDKVAAAVRLWGYAMAVAQQLATRSIRNPEERSEVTIPASLCNRCYPSNPAA